MALRIVPGSANRPLALAVADALRIEVTACELERFPDGELRPHVAAVRGDDVYVLQSTAPEVASALTELLLLLDATRRAGAARITALVPYFAYARQDRRSRSGEALGAPVVAAAIGAAGADRLVVIDPHTVALEAMCPVPTELLSARRVLADAIAPLLAPQAVVVAPDLGAAKLAADIGAYLDRPVAFVAKHRLGPAAVRADDLAGEVAGCAVLVVDDMISTGATIEAAVELCAARGATGPVSVVATHGVLAEAGAKRLGALGLATLLCTDTVATAEEAGVARCSVAPLLAEAVGRLHREEPLDDLCRAR